MDAEIAELRRRGCADEMVDSLGGVFRTSTDEGCFPHVGPHSPVGDCADAGVVLVYRRLFGACPGCSRHFSPRECRPFVCEADSECPWFATEDEDGRKIYEFVCERGLCQNPESASYDPQVIDQHEAMQLCFADLERQSDPYVGDPWCRGVDLASGSADPCPLPLAAACMQP